MPWSTRRRRPGCGCGRTPDGVPHPPRRSAGNCRPSSRLAHRLDHAGPGRPRSRRDLGARSSRRGGALVGGLPGGTGAGSGPGAAAERPRQRRWPGCGHRAAVGGPVRPAGPRPAAPALPVRQPRRAGRRRAGEHGGARPLDPERGRGVAARGCSRGPAGRAPGLGRRCAALRGHRRARRRRLCLAVRAAPGCRRRPAHDHRQPVAAGPDLPRPTVVAGINRSATSHVQRALEGRPGRSARRLGELGIAYVVVHRDTPADDPSVAPHERARAEAWFEEASQGRLEVVAEGPHVVVVATGSQPDRGTLRRAPPVGRPTCRCRRTGRPRPASVPPSSSFSTPMRMSGMPSPSTSPAPPTLPA